MAGAEIPPVPHRNQCGGNGGWNEFYHEVNVPPVGLTPGVEAFYRRKEPIKNGCLR
jgi:hypothetical protein